MPEGTEAVAISFDGVNVLLSERGSARVAKPNVLKLDDKIIDHLLLFV